tara:strand:+ start:723 stop:1283 length:561 start_codon:yes stop_codon:yes gene_type:complete
MRSFSSIGIVAAILLGGSGPAYAQDATLAGDLLADWQQQKAMMMAIAEAMPEETYGFKTTEVQRTYAEQILHIAGANVFLMQHVGGTTAAPQVDTSDFKVFGLPATSKAQVLQALSDGYDYGIAVLQEFSEEELLETIAGPRFFGKVTRVRMAYFTLSHAMDIYGQMAVYLRLNGVVPPASRRGGV